MRLAGTPLKETMWEAFNPTRKRIAEMKEAMRAFRDGETDEVEVDAPGGVTLRMVRDPDAESGMRIESSDGEPIDVPMPKSFDPSDERPDDYPEGILFLSGFRSIVSTMPQVGGLMVQYIGEGVVDGALDELCRMSVSEGWVEIAPDELDDSKWADIRAKAIARGVSESFMDKSRTLFQKRKQFRITKGDMVRTISDLSLSSNMTMLSLTQKRSAPE
jgi:hypothetical protein